MGASIAGHYLNGHTLRWNSHVHNSEAAVDFTLLHPDGAIRQLTLPEPVQLCMAAIEPPYSSPVLHSNAALTSTSRGPQTGAGGHSIFRRRIIRPSAHSAHSHTLSTGARHTHTRALTRADRSLTHTPFDGAMSTRGRPVQLETHSLTPCHPVRAFTTLIIPIEFTFTVGVWFSFSHILLNSKFEIINVSKTKIIISISNILQIESEIFKRYMILSHRVLF
jgi:hypothetical protein